jgi:enoyl-CoA hydratase/carnithine racemase
VGKVRAALATGTVRYDVADGVATIALDQPETRNALSDEVLDDLLAAFTRARDDDAVRCVVLASTHETTFSSGGNLAGFAADVPLIHKHLETTTKFPALFTLIGELGKPVVWPGRSGSRSRAISSSPATRRRSARPRSTSGYSRS